MLFWRKITRTINYQSKFCLLIFLILIIPTAWLIFAIIENTNYLKNNLNSTGKYQSTELSEKETINFHEQKKLKSIVKNISLRKNVSVYKIWRDLKKYISEITSNKVYSYKLIEKQNYRHALQFLENYETIK